MGWRCAGPGGTDDAHMIICGAGRCEALLAHPGGGEGGIEIVGVCLKGGGWMDR